MRPRHPTMGQVDQEPQLAHLLWGVIDQSRFFFCSNGIGDQHGLLRRFCPSLGVIGVDAVGSILFEPAFKPPASVVDRGIDLSCLVPGCHRPLNAFVHSHHRLLFSLPNECRWSKH